MVRRGTSQVLNQLLFSAFVAAGFAFMLGFPVASWSKDNQAADLIRAIRDGESKKADKLIQRGKNINAQDDYGWTPLLYAVLGNDIEMVEKLLVRGADINVQDHDGITPLIAAIMYAPQPFMVQYLPDKDKRAKDIPLILLEKGADPNRADNEGNTPLIYAVVGSHGPTVEALIKKGADPNRGDRSGGTPLYFINNPDRAAEWAPASGALSSRYRWPRDLSGESRFTPQYAEQVAKARSEANIMLQQIKARIAELLRAGGAVEPDLAKIQITGHHRLDSRPKRMLIAGPGDPLFEVLHGQMMSGKRPSGSRYHLLVRVFSDGTVKQALVVSGMPDGISEKLPKAALKLRYQPAMKNGQPVEDWDTIIGFFSSGTSLPGMIQ